MMSEDVYDRQAREVARLREAAEARLSIALAQTEAAQRSAARVQDVEAALRQARGNIARDDYAGRRGVLEALFGAVGCSVRIMAGGEVVLDGLLPVRSTDPGSVVHPSGDTTRTSSSPTVTAASRGSCSTSIRSSHAP